MEIYHNAVLSSSGWGGGGGGGGGLMKCVCLCVCVFYGSGVLGGVCVAVGLL